MKIMIFSSNIDMNVAVIWFVEHFQTSQVVVGGDTCHPVRYLLKKKNLQNL